jgi:8-oxo-dGTP pyrophosphatase MutT (NUDIX family)
MNTTLQGYLRHIERLNSWEPRHFESLFFQGRRIGRLKQPMREALSAWPEVFRRDERGLHLEERYDSFEARTSVLAEIVSALVAQGIISHIHGERYPVTDGGRETAIATVDRASAPYFGLRAYGQHLNGFVRDGDALSLWIARRSADRRNFPGCLDNMVAGGLPHDITLAENLRKECLEEANVPTSLADRARPVGVLTYCTETAVGLKPDTLYCYDLELPVDFQPANCDGEVAEFMLLPVDEVAGLVAQTDEFKLNCNLVVIDFLVRHGIINPETPGYLDLVQGLHENI